MSWLVILLIVLAATFAVLIVAALALWRKEDEAGRRLAGRIGRLPLRAKLRLATASFKDPRVPLLVRVIPLLLVLYLVSPIDLVPDFIPVLGQLDDVLILAVGVGLLLRFTPRAVLEEQISLLEQAQSQAPE